MPRSSDLWFQVNEANAREGVLGSGSFGLWLEFLSTRPACCRPWSGLGATIWGGRLGRCARRRLPTRDGRVLVVASMTGSSGSGAGGGTNNTVPIFMDGLETGDLPLVPTGFVRTIRTINGPQDAVPVLGDDLKRRVANLFPPERLFYADVLVLPLLSEDLITWLQYWKADVTEDASVRATTLLAHYVYKGDQRDAAIKMVEADNRKYERSPEATDGTVRPVEKFCGQDARLFSRGVLRRACVVTTGRHVMFLPVLVAKALVLTSAPLPTAAKTANCLAMEPV